MTSTEEVLIKLGLDSREFSARLREAQRNAQDAQKAFNREQQRRDGLDPVSASMASARNLSAKSQEALKGSATGVGALSTAMMALNPNVRALLANFKLLATKASLVLAPIAAVRWAIGSMKSAFHEVKEASDLGVSVSFMREVKLAAEMSGESFEEATGRMFKFQQVLGAAAEGSKEALDKLARVGIKDPTGKTMEENLRAVGAGLDNIEDSATRAKIAVELFGKGAARDMPDVLAELNKPSVERKMSADQDQDSATLAAGWKASKKLWANTGGKWLRDSKHGMDSILAANLEYYGGIEGKVEQPSKLEKAGEDPEKKQKDAEKLAKLQKELRDATHETYKTDSQLMYSREKLMNIQRELETKGLDELKRTELHLEYVKEERKEQELTKKLKEDAERVEQKSASYQKQAVALEREKAAAIRDARQAKSDRAGWSLGELSMMDQKDDAFDRRGRAIISDEDLRSVEESLGRRLTRAEIETMRDKKTATLKAAHKADNFEKTAKLGRLFGFSEDVIAKWQDNALGVRKTMESLTGSEKNPMEAMEKNIGQINGNISDLTSAALTDGIRIKPVMGK